MNDSIKTQTQNLKKILRQKERPFKTYFETLVKNYVGTILINKMWQGFTGNFFLIENF